MNYLKYLVSIIFLGCLISCSGSNDDVEPDPVIITPPSSASLVFPENNSECIEGSQVSDAESTVTFTWTASNNTDSYTVSLKNLNTSSSQNLNSSTNELSITLSKGVPYSWFVTSKANGTSETAISETWKFYNAGAANENYAPFPAEVLSPKMGANINAGTIELSWEGNDVDNDISSFDIFLDESNPPTTLLGNYASEMLNHDVISGQTYYWMVVTKDETGNTSNSEIFQFKVN